jgi:ADP-ribosylglycohydrolase
MNIKLGRDRAKLSAEITHNHPEGVKGAMAATDAIVISRFYVIVMIWAIPLTSALPSAIQDTN